jgi:hypothetical protein
VSRKGRPESATASMKERGEGHRCMGRDSHGLPKVLLQPALPYPSKPCGWATPKTTLQPFRGWPARRAGGLQLSFEHPTPYAYIAKGVSLEGDLGEEKEDDNFMSMDPFVP